MSEPALFQDKTRLRLFCLPHAGAGVSTYRPWGGLVPDWLVLAPLQPPGREERLAEPGFTSIREMARALPSAVMRQADHPFAIFGHSMGALAAFELAHELRRLGLPQPRALLLSGRAPPHCPLRRAPLHDLPDDQFAERLKGLGGTPPEVFEHPELLDLLMPTLRADFQACDTYRMVERPVLDLPIHVFGGRDDRDVPVDELSQWERHTSGPVSVEAFPGGHFYLMERRAELVAAIVQALASDMAGGLESRRRSVDLPPPPT
jgi:Predicted thioesterase involved in non-ribosomal peptide biosynthesis